MDIKELINETTECVENGARGVSRVGNRMHYPMLLFTNLVAHEQKEQINQIFTKGFRKIWPQTYKTIISIGYSNAKTDEFTEMNSDEKKTIDEIQETIIATQRNAEAFESLLKWCTYNIIDTTSLNSFEEFKRLYDSIEIINDDIFQNTTRSIAIVILDDTSLRREKQEMLKTVKSYIKENHTKYNGVLLVSNCSRDNVAFDLLDDIIPMLVSAIILINNDNVGGMDDDDYSRRASCFFGNRIMVVSHSIQKKPSKGIAIQMLNSVIESANTMLNQPSSDNVDWKSVLGIENGKIKKVDEMLARCDFNPDWEEIKHMPFRAIPGNMNEIHGLRYSEFSGMLYSGYFDEYMNSYCANQDSSDTISKFLKEYIAEVYSKVNASECIDLTESKIDNIFNTIMKTKPSTELPLGRYFSEYVRYYLKYERIYPEIRRLLAEMSKNASKTKEDFEEFTANFEENIPIYSDDIGDSYKNLADNFATSIEGTALVKSLTTPGYKEEDFIKKLKDIFDKIMADNASDFSRTFVDEWQWRLDRSGADNIYKNINATFGNHFEKRVFIKAEFPLNDLLLEAYMLHTYDRNGDNETELYRKLKEAFSVRYNVQFVNTGYDDVVEAFRIIDCTNHIF